MAEVFTPGQRVTTFASLRRRDFRWYWIGEVFGFAALQMQILARGWLVYQMTGSALALGLVSAGWGLPVVALAFLGGTVADRVAKRRLIVATEALFSLVAFGVAILIATGAIQLWHLVAAALVTGFGFIFNAPARVSFVPDLVTEREVMNAYALNYAGMNLMRVMAPAIGGFLVALLGVGGVYFIIAALYGLGAVTIALVKAPGRSLPAQTSLRQEMARGVAFLRVSPTLTYLLGMLSFITLLAMPYLYLLPVFAADVLRVGEVGLGWMMAMMGLGAVAGTLTIASLGDFRHKGRLLLGLASLFGACLLLFSQTSSFPLALALLVGVGGGNMGYMAINQTLLQTHTPREFRGRVGSLVMMSFGLSTLGGLGFGGAADLWGAPLAVGVGGLAVLLLMASASLSPRLRGLS